MNAKSGIEKAAAGTAAGYDKRQHQTYPKAESQSSLKSEIGTLLLCLQFPVGQPLSQIGWGLFERLLREYIGLRISHNAREGHSERPESKNSGQRVVR